MDQQAAIEKLIFDYSSAFNAADITKTVALYSPEGILMPNNGPVAQGQNQLTKSFYFLFSKFQIEINYHINEITISGDYAYVRTNSIVKTFVKANNELIVLENKELFVVQKLNDDWKISHYIFNNTATQNN